MTRILVTGGLGFIGSHLVDRLVKTHRVDVIDDQSSGRIDNRNPRAYYWKANIADPRVGDFIGKREYDFILHFAAQSRVRYSIFHPINTAMSNIIGTLQVLRKAGKALVIYASSGGAIYAEGGPHKENEKPYPKSPYGVSKYAGEEYVAILAHHHVNLRLGNVYGPRQRFGVIPSFIHNMKHGKPCEIYGSGSATRDFIHVDDVMDLIERVINSPFVDFNLNVGTGIPTSIVEISRQIAQYFPPNHFISCDFNPFEIHENYLDISKAKSLYNWEPHINIFQGLKELVHAHRLHAS